MKSRKLNIMLTGKIMQNHATSVFGNKVIVTKQQKNKTLLYYDPNPHIA